MNIKIHKNPYDNKKNLYKYDNLELKTGITILVGRNGIGKTTLLSQIKEFCEKNKIDVFKYDNYRDGGDSAKNGYSFYNDFESLATVMQSSEGEELFYNFSQACIKLGSFARRAKGNKLVILFDAMDSGLDIDGVDKFFEFANIVITDNKNKEVYFLATANSYNMIHGQQCFDVKTGKYVTFKDYEEFRNFILKQYKEV